MELDYRVLEKVGLDRMRCEGPFSSNILSGIRRDILD